jgi:two-component system, OmpR family, alkaline phosphatase synthesis response regulator PhoP
MGETKPMRILVVDDDTDILDLLKYNLEKEGFKIKAVQKSSKAMRAAAEFSPDLIILDLMMPHPTGIELCREFRDHKRFKDTFIFFLTAKSEDYYRQAVLDTGGDDYVEKMMGLRTLTFKIQSVLRKKFIIRKGVVDVKMHDVILHRRSSSLTMCGRSVPLSRQEFDLLLFFAQNAGRVIAYKDLVQLIWGPDVFVSTASVHQCITALNHKTGSKLIDVLYDHRYRFKSSQ